MKRSQNKLTLLTIIGISIFLIGAGAAYAQTEQSSNMRQTIEALEIQIAVQQTVAANTGWKETQIANSVQATIGALIGGAPAIPPTPIAPVIPPKPVIPCNQAELMEALDTPDGTEVGTNQKFSKTFRIRNSGSCPWTPEYTIIFTKGFRFAGSQTKRLGKIIEPGEIIDLRLDLGTPAGPAGYYFAEYMLQAPNGETFGMFAAQQGAIVPLRVKINLKDKSPCSLIAVQPPSVSPGAEFDGKFTIKNNTGKNWGAKGIDIRIVAGDWMLKYPDKILRDLGKDVPADGSITLTYDLKAPDESGSKSFTLRLLNGGETICDVPAWVYVK